MSPMEYTQELEIVEGKKPSAFKRVLLVLLITVMLLGGTAYAAGYILIHGPSAYAGRQFVETVGENPVARVFLRLYMSDAELDAVLTAEDASGYFSVYPNAG